MFSNFAEIVSERANGISEWRIAALVLSFLLYRTFRKWLDGSRVSPSVAVFDCFTRGDCLQLLLKEIGAYLFGLP